jgi:hypothetical protein
MGEKEIQYRGFKKQKTKNIKLSSEMLLNARQGGNTIVKCRIKKPKKLNPFKTFSLNHCWQL